LQQLRSYMQEEDLERTKKFGSDSVLISFVHLSYSHAFRWKTTNKSSRLVLEESLSFYLGGADKSKKMNHQSK
jgi:hypothetical protein